MSVFGKTAQELLEERLQAQRQALGTTIQRNIAQARTPQEVAGTGVGNLLGALGAKYFIKDPQLDPDAVARDQAATSVFNVPLNEQSQTTTPDGGIVNQSRQRSRSEMFAEQARRLDDFMGKYSTDSDTFKLSLQLKQAALDSKKSEQQAALQQEAIKDLSPEKQAAIMSGLVEGKEYLNPQDAFRPLTNAEKIAAKIPTEQFAQINEKDNS